MSSPISAIQTVQLGKLISSPAISANAISNFQAASNATTQGIDVTFTLTDLTGISSITLFRNYVLDQATATVIQSWNPALAAYTYSDTSTTLQEQASAYYWLLLLPQGTSGSSQVVGPQSILLNPQLGTPEPSSAISASSSAGSNGSVTITVNVTGAGASEKIYVSGYKGNAAFVAIAQSANTPIQFSLETTGETVTLKAIAVSLGGTEATSGPTTTVVLNGVLTVPAAPQDVVINQIATGNQVSFPASRDGGPNYKIYRATVGQAFGVATLLATVTGTSGTITYLDTAGLSGNWEYFVVASNAAGDSLPSTPTTPLVLYSSAVIPANVSANTTNTATIDSLDAGASASVRIYGPGGVGTSYNRVAGFGNTTRPSGTVTGLSYNTLYAILWTGTTYTAVSNYPGTLPDGYEFVGSLTTTAQTGAVGSGAAVTFVIDTNGHIIQANPSSFGALYLLAQVTVGGPGTGAVIIPNISAGGITSYTVQDGGTGFTSIPTGTVTGVQFTGTIGGGGSTGSSSGSRNVAPLP